MKRVLVLAMLLSGCGGAPDTEQPTTTPDRVSVSLPDDPVAPWTAAIIERNCAACHSAEMIANQPPLAADKWQATIDKMRSVYAARIDTANDAALIAALKATQTR